MVQLVGGEVVVVGEAVVDGGETVVPDGFLGHSFPPVVDRTQSITSAEM